MGNVLSNLKLNLRYGLRLNKPKLIGRIIKSYLKALVSPLPPLRYIDFAIDWRCNLYCQHCFATSLRKVGTTKLTLLDYRRIAQEAEKIGVLHISFQGGEPLLIPKELEKIINVFDPEKFYIAVTTNGTLLTSQKVGWLKKIGVDKITVSLDSMNAKEHDSFRRVKGTFAKTWKGIEQALKAGFRITINTTLTHQNLHIEGIQKLFQYAMENKIILNPVFAAPVGRWLNESKMMLTNEDVKYISNLQKKSPYIRRDVDSNYFRWGCCAVKEVIYVDPYGNVIPCPFLHIILGNLKKESLADILEKALKYPPFRNYSQKCLASEDQNFLKLMRKSYKRLGFIPFTLQEFSGNQELT